MIFSSKNSETFAIIFKEHLNTQSTMAIQIHHASALTLRARQRTSRVITRPLLQLAPVSPTCTGSEIADHTRLMSGRPDDET